MLSYYEILGIDADAGNEEIQAAYDGLLNQCYASLRDPKTHNESVEKIKQITQARNVLLDADLRKKYDTAASTEEIEKSAPHDPWGRFLARFFDQLIFWGIFYLVYKYFANYVFFEDWKLALEFAGVGIILTILIETAEFAIFGTTLGKWMLSVEVTATDGQKAKRLRLVKRNFIAVLFGLGLYLPPFVFITMIMQYRKSKKEGNDGLAPWDRACSTAVSYAKTKSYRLLLIIPALVLVIVCLINAFR